MGQSVTAVKAWGQEFGNQLPALGQALWVTSGLFNLPAPQPLVSRLEMKLLLFYLCSGLSAEARSCWLRDEPCSCTEHSWGPAALRGPITTVITHKGALNQGKDHLFPGREFSLFIPSVYWGGIHL